MNRLAIIRDLRQYQWRIKLKYWEIIADNFSKAGWSLGWVSAVDFQGRTILIAEAHRGDEKRFIARADKVTAFMELETAILVATRSLSETGDEFSAWTDVRNTSRLAM
jgi:hypothetical protein